MGFLTHEKKIDNNSSDFIVEKRIQITRILLMGSQQIDPNIKRFSTPNLLF
jgi:hypothetical protein